MKLCLTEVRQGKVLNTDRPHTWQHSESAASQDSLHAKHIQLILKIDYNICMMSNKRKYHNHLQICWMSKQAVEEGQGTDSVCDHLALCKEVQWKNVPAANPWQANYSFDPLGMFITRRGREQQTQAHHS